MLITVFSERCNFKLSYFLCRPIGAHWLWDALYTGAYAPACKISPLWGSFLRPLGYRKVHWTFLHPFRAQLNTEC